MGTRVGSGSRSLEEDRRCGRTGENASWFSPTLLMGIQQLSLDPRITVRKPGAPNPEGDCVVYWMQRAQRALDNPALDVAVKLGNELGKPVVAFLAPVPFYPHANLRHYRFLASGIPDIEEGLSKRNVVLSCGRTLIIALQIFVNRSARPS
jgi:DNA photolyase